MSTRTITRPKDKIGILIIIGVVVVVMVSIIMIANSTIRQDEAKRQTVAAHWQKAGIENPVTTLKSDGNKSTTGAVGTCTVTVEGFTDYTNVTVKTNQGRWHQEETRFRPMNDDPRSADSAAFSFIEGIPASLATYCSHG